MAACELLLALASYNLIRAVMAEAARQINVEPGDLSFSRSRSAFRAFARAVAHTDSEAEFDRHWRLPIRIIGQSKLYRRKRPAAPEGSLAQTTELPQPEGPEMSDFKKLRYRA
jgi:hypothetical protein